MKMLVCRYIISENRQQLTLLTVNDLKIMLRDETDVRG